MPKASQNASILQPNQPLERYCASFSAELFASQASVLTTDPSIAPSCKPACSAKWLKSFPDTPLAHQRKKVLKMLFHLPCVGGKSRQCDPEHNSHKQALTKRLQVSGDPT